MNMLQSKKPLATLAVQNLERAKQFYEGKIGMKSSPGRKEGILLFETGGAPLLVYESRFAGTNQATAVTWSISEGLAGLVKDLREKGVVFEHYDIPGVSREGDLHQAGVMKVAWFKDPDGNIHALNDG
jgi:catechol 2,3-dioxygenase-like lactoylglutathione lyase family enzyme